MMNYEVKQPVPVGRGMMNSVPRASSIGIPLGPFGKSNSRGKTPTELVKLLAEEGLSELSGYNEIRISHF